MRDYAKGSPRAHEVASSTASVGGRRQPGREIPECPVHGSQIAAAGCEVCDCRWLLANGEAEDPSRTALDLIESGGANRPLWRLRARALLGEQSDRYQVLP